MEQEFLVRLDVGVPGASLRVLLGAAFAWLVVTFAITRLWAAALLFIGMLFFIKVAAGVARAVVPAPPKAKEIWGRRRHLARTYDSFQWRKLLWFGIGMLGFAVTDRRGGWLMPLGAACVVSGAIAMVFWRRVASAHVIDLNGNAGKS